MLNKLINKLSIEKIMIISKIFRVGITYHNGKLKILI